MVNLNPKPDTAYFSPEFFKFLKDLARNNNREWFARNKPRYEKFVLGPSLRFIKDAREPLKTISPYLVADPRPSGGPSSESTAIYASRKTRVPTRPTWPWSSGTTVEKKFRGRGFTCTWHLDAVLLEQAFGILMLHRSARFGKLSCRGQRLGEKSRRAG